MIKKYFTLIELLAVLLIFGILASIGLSVSKPSPVKNELSKSIASIQQTRALALQNTRTYRISFNTDNKFEFSYIDPFTTQEQKDGRQKSFHLNMVDLKFYQKDLEIDPSKAQLSFLSDGTLDMEGSSWIDSIEIFDGNNTKNAFLISISSIGSYTIYSSRDEIKAYLKDVAKDSK